MHVVREETDGRLEQFRQALQQAGVKLTHQRMEIIRELVSTGDHPGAEAVYRGVRRRVPTISLDTVYRTLWLLHDLGLVTTLGPQRDRLRFDANNRPHHHFVCTGCGKVWDFYSGRFDRLSAPQSVLEMGSITETYVEFRGLCSACAEDSHSC